MGSKSVKIVIIIAVVIGIIAIVGITALVVYTTKSSEPKVIDLNDEIQSNDFYNDEEETDYDLDDEEKNIDLDEEENNQEQSINENDSSENSEVESFNSKFEEYKGDRVSSEKVNELLDLIWKNNDENQEQKIKPLAKVQNWDRENNKAVEGCYYNIDFEKDSETGYINVLKIEDAD